jgi:hypothetical protein
MSGTGFKLDMGDFDKRIKEMGSRADKAARLGLWEGAAALKLDADNISPKTPHLHGNLKGDTKLMSAKRIASYKKESTRIAAEKKNKQIRPDWFPKVEKEDLGPSMLSVLVAYCAPYAERWHETTDAINWSEPGVGPKFLEAKMARQDLRDKYYGLIAARIKKELADA